MGAYNITITRLEYCPKSTYHSFHSPTLPTKRHYRVVRSFRLVEKSLSALAFADRLAASRSQAFPAKRYRCLWNKHLFRASLRPAIQRQEWLSSPRCGALGTHLPTRPLLQRGVYVYIYIYICIYKSI